MSQSSADSGAGQSGLHNLETTTNTHAAKIKDEYVFTAGQRIVSWYTKIEQPAGHHEIIEEDARNDSGLSEDWRFTPLHKLLQRANNENDGMHELEKHLYQWTDILDVRSSEHQETALHMAVRKGFNKMARQLLTAGAQVNIENDRGELPLHLACEGGNEQLVEVLLEYDANPEYMDASGIYPLHSAIARDFGATVMRRLLGSKGSIINKTFGRECWTPLNKAVYHKCGDVVDILLEEGASLLIKDLDGWTPFMTAIKRGPYKTFHRLLEHLREHLTEVDVVIIPDNDGMTPLMQLSANEPGELSKRAIEDLLLMHPDVNATDKKEKTALHHLMASSAYRMAAEPDIDVALELIRLMSVKSLLQLDKDGETAFDFAFDEDEKGPVSVFRPLLDSLVDRLAQGAESIEEPLCWASYRLERHTIAQNLFQKRFSSNEIPQDLRHDQWTIVEWAIYARMPRVLLTYLRALGLEKRAANKDENIDKITSNGRSLIETLKQEIPKSSTFLVEGKRQKGERGPTSADGSSQDAQVLRNMEDILENIQDYLYPGKSERPTNPLELSKPEESMASSLSRFRAAIIQSNFVKFRTIQEVLYDVDSMEHIQDNTEWLKQFDYTPHASPEQESQANTRASAQFTWIHLPSTNMVWMEDTAKMILKGEGCERNEAEKVASFLRSSWIEIPDRTSTSRFMRPRYVAKKADKATKQDSGAENELEDPSERGFSQTDTSSRRTDPRDSPSSEDYPGEDRSLSFEDFSTTTGLVFEGSHVSRAVQVVDTDPSEAEEDKSFAVSAIYMPYLYFSTYHQSESGEQMADVESSPDLEGKLQAEIEMREALFKAYEHSVIHQPTTLDEFYYQFASDKDSVRDRNMRNKDQIVTKYLRRGDIGKQRSWPLLRVGQLWVWTIDEKWLITSTSCATNDIRDNLVTDILEHLRRQVQNGSRRFGPTSATEMSRVIVDYCIGTYDRKRSRERTEERSIHQIFSDSINEIGRKESSLFSLSYGRHDHARETDTGPDTDHSSEMMKDLQTALKLVADQLCHIKDIRDELNILMSIARFQRKVQSTMARSGPDEDLSSEYLLRDIKELDKFAEQTQEAVKTTLTLQESNIASFQAQIANWQASESVDQGKESVKQGEQAVKQGKIVLVFTLVTVWFLPLSFLTSLFALDVESFLEAPAWAFYVIFLVPLIFLGSAVFFVWKTEIRGYLVHLGILTKGSGEEAKGGTSTARFNPLKRATRRRKRIDVEHG